MKKRYILLIAIFTFLLGITKVNAMTVKPGGSSTGKVGQEITLYITLNRTSDEKTVSSIDGTFSYDENVLQLVNFNVLLDDNWSKLSGIKNNTKFSFANLTFDNLISNTSQNIVKIIFKVKDNAPSGNTIVSINNPIATDENAESITISGGKHTVKILSNVNTLSNITVTGTTFSFDENTTEYNLKTDNASINISATKKDSTSSVSGDIGTKSLKYGLNTFSIVVTSESGSTKTYKLYITRNDTRNNNVNLGSLDPVSGFQRGTTLYNVSIPSNQSTYKVTGKAEASTSIVTYSPSNEIKLNYGETKTISITVTAENGSKKTYTVNVTRKDDRSNNNNLKSLAIKDIDVKFKSSTTSYKATVENNIEEIEINAEAADKSAKIEGIGKHQLKVGSNNIKVIVTAENGSKKTYTITVIRKDENGNVEKLSNNAKIKSIKINNQDLTIKDNVFTYSLSVENEISIIDLTYELDDQKASAVLEGNNELLVGNNKFKIIVTAEDGSIKTYEILIERKDLNKTVENNKESILNAIGSSEDDIVLITVKNNDDNRVIEKEILEELKSKDKTLIYEVLNEYNGLNYSITIKGSDVLNTSNGLDYGLTFESNNKSAIDKLSNNSKSVYLNFNSHGELPGLSKFKVFVGNNFDDKEELYLYYYNEETNKLELIKSNLKIEDSYVEFELEHFSEYILVASLIKENNDTVVTTSFADYKIVWLGIGSFIVIGLIIFIIIKNKKNEPKEKNLNTTNNTNISNDNNTKVEVKLPSLKDETKQENKGIPSKDEVKVENSQTNENITNDNKDNNNDVEIIDM